MAAEAAHGVRHPLVAWSIALPCWIALGAVTIWLAPGAAYLWLLPLLSAGLLLSIIPRRTLLRYDGLRRCFCDHRCALAENREVAAHFMVPMFGRLHCTPAYVYAAVMTWPA